MKMGFYILLGHDQFISARCEIIFADALGVSYISKANGLIDRESIATACEIANNFAIPQNRFAPHKGDVFLFERKTGEFLFEGGL